MTRTSCVEVVNDARLWATFSPYFVYQLVFGARVGCCLVMLDDTPFDLCPFAGEGANDGQRYRFLVLRTLSQQTSCAGGAVPVSSSLTALAPHVRTCSNVQKQKRDLSCTGGQFAWCCPSHESPDRKRAPVSINQKQLRS